MEAASFSGSGKVDADDNVVCRFAPYFHALAISFSVIAVQKPVAGKENGIPGAPFLKDVFPGIVRVTLAVFVEDFHRFGGDLQRVRVRWKNGGYLSPAVHFPLARFSGKRLVGAFVKHGFDDGSIRVEGKGCFDGRTVFAGEYAGIDALWSLYVGRRFFVAGSQDGQG